MVYGKHCQDRLGVNIILISKVVTVLLVVSIMAKLGMASFSIIDQITTVLEKFINVMSHRLPFFALQSVTTNNVLSSPSDYSHNSPSFTPAHAIESPDTTASVLTVMAGTLLKQPRVIFALGPVGAIVATTVLAIHNYLA